jgi:hypothetical protein
MAYISMIDYETASPEARTAHDEHKKIGNITNMKKTLLNSVPAFNALMEWYTLRDEAAKFLTPLEINFFCYAISSENDCLICSTFSEKFLKTKTLILTASALPISRSFLYLRQRACQKPA